MNKQQGMALVLVLWILSLLTIMAGSFALSMRRETEMVSGLRNNAEAMATAESGLAIAEWMLQNPDADKRWRADGSIYQIDTANGKLRIRLLSETGKININTATLPLLQSVISNAPVATNQQSSTKIDLAAAIIDWLDGDELVSINGAEKAQYHDAGLNYWPRNQRFQSLEELQMVLGMDAEMFKWLEPLVTVYSEHTQVEYQLASKEVLEVMPEADTGLIDSYVVARAESAKNNLPAPPFPLAAGQVANTGGDVNLLTIVSEVQFNDRSTALINALVKKSLSQITPFEVLRWQNGATNESLFTPKMSELVVKNYAESELNN